VVYAGCWRVQGDLAVSRAFGDAHLKNFGVSATPELSAIRLTPRDAFLVLASDGLWDVVDEQQCAASVLRASDPLAAARSLCDLASTVPRAPCALFTPSPGMATLALPRLAHRSNRTAAPGMAAVDGR
jgi:hypothetical protein